MTRRGLLISIVTLILQALPGGQVQTPLGPGDEAWRKGQERKGGVQWFLQELVSSRQFSRKGHTVCSKGKLEAKKTKREIV